jgi:hypothetical protein
MSSKAMSIVASIACAAAATAFAADDQATIELNQLPAEVDEATSANGTLFEQVPMQDIEVLLEATDCFLFCLQDDTNDPNDDGSCYMICGQERWDR